MAYATRSWIETQFQNFSNRITSIFAKKKDVGNGTITIKQAGISKGTFTTNQSGNTTIELTDNNTTYSAATQSENGLMYAADKKKLDGIEAGANKTTLTKSLAVTKEGVSALDGTVGKILNDKFGGCTFEQEGNDFYIIGADAVRKKLGDSLDIKFFETSAKLSTSSFTNIECGFKPRYFIYTMFWGGDAIAAYLVNLDKGTEKAILHNSSGTKPTNKPTVEAAISIIYEVYDTGIRLRAPYNYYAQNTCYFYIFG